MFDVPNTHCHFVIIWDHLRRLKAFHTLYAPVLMEHGAQLETDHRPHAQREQPDSKSHRAQIPVIEFNPSHKLHCTYKVNEHNLSRWNHIQFPPHSQNGCDWNRFLLQLLILDFDISLVCLKVFWSNWKEIVFFGNREFLGKYLTCSIAARICWL